MDHAEILIRLGEGIIVFLTVKFMLFEKEDSEVLKRLKDLEDEVYTNNERQLDCLIDCIFGRREAVIV